MFDLTGKTVLITGAGGGLGSSMARTFHAHGATLVLHDRSQEGLASILAELKERVFSVTGDLSDPAVPAKLIKDAEEASGTGIDILVNNAGLTRDGLAMRMKDEDWDLVLQVNLSAAFRLTRAAMKGMMSRRWGRVISIASVVGVMGNAGQANYAASKGGLIAMSKSIAREIASRGVTVNCIAPGFIISPMTDLLNEEQKAAMLANIPLGYLGEAKDVAASALFLASEEARYITGQTLNVNGGMAMV